MSTASPLILGATLLLAVATGLAQETQQRTEPRSTQPAGQPAPKEQARPLETPDTPKEAEGLIAVEAVSATVRPARREFSDERMRQLRVPQGFTVSVFAQDLENPRSIEVAPNGDVYVAEREAGRVRLLRDTSGDGRADVSRIVAKGIGEDMEGVHGLAVHDNRLYMVTVNELYSAPIQRDGELGERTRHIDDLPDGGQHPNRTMKWGPDGMLYLSVGSQTNGVPEPGRETATMMRVNPEDWTREVYAEGLRNTIGFGWHPVSGHFYGLDHNTDHRGDNWPPEEINRIEEGRHYGWPFCGGDREVDWHVAQNPDTDEDRQTFCAGTEPPVLTYTAHAAPMQMVFYTGTQFPAEYRHDAFVTMRGSWNRNPPAGYEVVRVRFDEQGEPRAVEPFVSGWLIENGRAHFGRLMGLAQSADGSLLVGDDANGVIYRIAHGTTATSTK
jgi:glucose/arabinose dehydrogenase